MTNPTKKSDGKVRDIDIRVPFMKRNLKFFEKEGMEFCNEYGINSSNVIDLAGFDFPNKVFYGFEIKSEQDNIDRLFKQLNSYITFFNFVYVITYENHTREVLELLDNTKHFDKVGVIEVTKGMNFKEIRRARKYSQIYYMFINNLDLEEVRLMAVEHNIPLEGTKQQLLGSLRRYVSLDEVFKGIQNKLRKYRNWKCPICGSGLYYNKKNGHVCFKCDYECY